MEVLVDENNVFLGVISISILKDFLSLEQKRRNTHSHDVEKYYNEE
jgi:hypothetical protein